jgi:multiple sugar transport system ATP-binding protein
MAGVVLKNVVKTYPGGVTAVNNLNIDIRDKEFIVLAGPTGCGKTTTLKMIAGLEEITSGEIFIGDKLCNDVAPKDRNIAMVFQNCALYPDMTVFDNMAFGLKLRKTPKEEIKKRVHDAARILSIEHLLDKEPEALSGCQRQRVALGRVIVHEPKVFLMDEPLSTLDADLRVQMRADLSRLHQKLNITFIYVTGDQTEALAMGTRIAVMKDGIIQQVGTPQKLYHEPVNQFVAGFIGSPQMNFAGAAVVKENGKIFLEFGEYKLLLPSGKAEILEKLGYIGKEIVFGIRPEDIHNESTGPENGSGVLNASVEAAERLDSETFLYTMIHDLSFTARVSPGLQTQAGETIKLVFDMDRMHIFDKKTEKCIAH